eukprot:4803525-Lingulodinium_polyedra.AAC.1
MGIAPSTVEGNPEAGIPGECAAGQAEAASTGENLGSAPSTAKLAEAAAAAAPTTLSGDYEVLQEFRPEETQAAAPPKAGAPPVARGRPLQRAEAVGNVLPGGARHSPS